MFFFFFFSSVSLFFFIACHGYKSLDYTIYGNPYPKQKKNPPTTVTSTKIILEENLINPWYISHSLNGQALSPLFFSFLLFCRELQTHSKNPNPNIPHPSDHTSKLLPFPTFQGAPHPRESSFHPHTHAQHTTKTQPIYI